MKFPIDGVMKLSYFITTERETTLQMSTQTTTEAAVRFTACISKPQFKFMEQQRAIEGRNRSNYIQAILKREQQRSLKRK